MGDLLAGILMQAQIATEASEFTIEDVVEGITRKLIRRHPHVFGDAEAATAAQVLKNWNQIKRDEKAANGKGPSEDSPLDRLPRSMPSLLRAADLVRSGALRLDAADTTSIGDRLLVEVNAAVAANLDPEQELERALRRRLAPVSSKD